MTVFVKEQIHDGQSKMAESKLRKTFHGIKGLVSCGVICSICQVIFRIPEKRGSGGPKEFWKRQGCCPCR